MTKTEQVINALLDGETISSEIVIERFEMHPTGMGAVITKLTKMGYHVDKRKEGKVTFYKLTDQPVAQKMHQPQVGDTLKIRSISLDEKDEIEIMAIGEDGTYLIQVLAFKAGRK